jgi:alpha-mannosidase
LTTAHPAGRLAQRACYLSVDQPNIVVSAVKLAEEGDDLIVRAYESWGVPSRATIRLPEWERVVESAFGGSEIKTFRIPRAADRPVVETNLLEWEE